MKFFATIVFFLLMSSAFAQLKPDFLPEDVTSIGTSEAICYCKPGVVNKSRSKGLSLSYGVFYGGDYNTEADSGPGVGKSDLSNLNSFDFKLKIPLLLNDHTRILLGYDYFFEQYEFNENSGDFLETVGTLENRALKSTGLSAILSHSLNEKNYLLFRYKYAVNGNYEGFVEINGRNGSHNLLGLYGIKKTELQELGFGILLSKNFRSTNIIPILLYNKTFNSKWGIEAVLPANVFLRCNFDVKTLSVLGVEYNSKSFRLNVEDPIGGVPLDFAYNHSDIQFSLEVERHISSWIWANAKVGYQQNFNSDFETKTNFAPTFDADVQGGPFFQIGIFVSPTSKEEVEHRHDEPHDSF